MRKHYKRMIKLILPLFNSGDTVDGGILKNTLIKHQLLEIFESIYQQDCQCSGDWHFFDFSDRFGRFANELIRVGIVQKIANGKYQML